MTYDFGCIFYLGVVVKDIHNVLCDFDHLIDFLDEFLLKSYNKTQEELTLAGFMGTSLNTLVPCAHTSFLGTFKC